MSTMGGWADDALQYGTGLLDSVGEGWDSLVDTVTRPTDSVNANTQPQSTQQADNNGNAVTGNQTTAKPDNTLLYVGGGIGVVLILGLFVIALKK